MVPGAPPDTGSALSHSGGSGTSSVGVALPSQDIGRPTEPSAYPMAIAALYSLSSDSMTSLPSRSAVVMVALVCDQ